MQAPSVQSQSNITSSPMPGAKQQNAADVPFSQMLTQQVADRSNASSNANKASDANKTNDARKASNSSNSNKDSVSKQAPAGNADATDAKSVETDKAKIAEDGQRTDSSTAVPASAQLTALVAAPASVELIALIANQLSQANAKPIDTSAVTSDEGKTIADDLTSLTAGRSIAGAKNSLSKQAEITPSTDKTSAAELTGKETSLKPGAGFAATMLAIEQTAGSKQSLQLAAAKVQEALPAVTANTLPQLQQTALNIAQTVAAQPTDKLTPQVGSPAWDQALGQKVVWMVAGTQQSASLTLNPPDLGPMQVVLNVTNGHADAAFIASQPEVRQALEAALPKLREMMSDAGIQLGQATISAGMPNQQNNSGEQTKQNSRGPNQAGDSIETTARISGTTRIIGGQGLVDTFA